MPTAHDREILRTLAKRVAEIAALPVQQERIALWKAHNAMRSRRPMVLFFPEGAWRELLPDSELQCEDKFCRRLEHGLRQRIYQHEHNHGDHPIEATLHVAPVRRIGDYGLPIVEQRTEALGAAHWDPPIKRPEDVRKLHIRRIEVDHDETARQLAMAGELVGDLLKVRMRGSLRWSSGLTWTLIELRGLDQMMLDMYDDPPLLHEIMTVLRDDALNEWETYEREGVLSLNNGPEDYVGSGGVGAIEELPADGFDGKVRLRDLWALGESQELVGVGPEMFYEFALQYQLPILNRFGLVCYGCCEPLDQKFDLILKHIPRLRRVSVSPWCNRKIAAEKLRGRCIYSWKPNPVLVSGPTANWDEVERGTRETLRMARGCCVEIIMKDTHTLAHDPSRLDRWTETVSRIVREES